MANPNIVAVSTIHAESIGESLTATLTTDIMTVSANKLVKINYISVANTHASTAVDVTLKVVKAGFTSGGIASGEDNTGAFALCSTINLPADDVLIVIDRPVYLQEGDVLEGGASPATADIFISYEVLDDA
jgi:hypothetical protein